jgi:uncharacterized protein (DUF58 family)
VYLLLDTSASMSFGSPTKLDWSVHAAAALAYMALCSQDRVQLFAHPGDPSHTRVLRGRGAATEAFEWLSRLHPNEEPGQGTQLARAADAMLRTVSRPGLVFLLSDLLCEDWQPALRHLAAAKGDVCVLQVLSPDEFEPSLRGDLKLLDVETGEGREITMGPAVTRRYREERDAFFAAIQSSCSRYGFARLLSLTDEPVEDSVLLRLRRLQVVR